MSITQSYCLALSARGKLVHEAARPDLKLRLLVGHANMLDQIMLDLTDNEEQTLCIKQSVAAACGEETPLQDQEALPEESEVQPDSESVIEWIQGEAEMEKEMAVAFASSTMLEVDRDTNADFEEDVELTLTRTPSWYPPPGVGYKSDSDDSDEEGITPIFFAELSLAASG